MADEEFDEEFDAFDDVFSAEPLSEDEAAMVARDLADLDDFEATFAAEGYRGVAVFCHDCVEEHLYPWGMLRENLTTLIETGETPVHEPAFAPDPARYIPWDYARGYVDAIRDSGLDQRADVDTCHHCGLALASLAPHANFCPRCGHALLAGRLAQALREAGLDDDVIQELLRKAGL